MRRLLCFDVIEQLQKSERFFFQFCGLLTISSLYLKQGLILTSVTIIKGNLWIAPNTPQGFEELFDGKYTSLLLNDQYLSNSSIDQSDVVGQIFD